ncbi:MAG: hypothetical protein JSW40_03595, partial [Candidatus Omnitrophota bacterium]
MKKKLKKANGLVKSVITLYCMLCFPGSDRLLKYVYGKRLFSDIIPLWAKKTRDFFFIQIGSCDGVKRDLIHGHILKYYFSCILVEPVRFLFQRLIKN